MVIISMMLYLGLGYMQQKTFEQQIDRTALQIQQILNAALNYYVINGSWPLKNLNEQLNPQQVLQKNGYLSYTGTMNNPWGDSVQPTYQVGSPSMNGPFFFVFTAIGSTPTAVAAAQAIAGKVPAGMACNNYNQTSGQCSTPCGNGVECFIVASVNTPGQSANNAIGVNYAGLYHSGACVKAPACPKQVGNPPVNMSPDIMVVPVSVAGANDAPTGSTCSATNLSGCSISTYPITNFTGYATSSAQVLTSGTAATPPSCANPTISPGAACISDSNNTPLTNTAAGDTYWRVCIAVSADKSGSPITPTGPNTNPWGQLMGTVMVLTRCVPAGESMGSGFDVYQP